MEELEFEHSQLIPQRRARGRLPGNGSGNGAVPAQDGRESQLKHLWNRHHKMKRLAILGMSTKDIAAELEMSENAVRQCLNSELMKRELSVLRAAVDLRTVDIAAKIQESAAKATEMLDEFMSDENTPIHIRTKICLEMLSRHGFGPHVKFSGIMDHRFYSDQEIEAIKARAQDSTAAARAAGLITEISDENVVDVPYEQTT
jgi:uncharacterized protein (UPF0147 family)